MSSNNSDFKLFSYQEQLKKCEDPTDDYGNIWRNSEWTIKDYEEFFEDIERGYIIQEDNLGNYFVINEDWEDEEEEEEDSDAEYNRRCENGEAKCEECGKWGQALDMDYDDDTGFHICCGKHFSGDKDL